MSKKSAPAGKTSVSVAGPVCLVSDADTPLIVRMAKEEKPPSKPNWWPVLVLGLVVSALMGIYAMVWLLWIYPREYLAAHSAAPEIPEIVVGLSYPRYLAVGDAGEIEISATNRSTATLSGTVSLFFDPDPGVHATNEEGTVLRFEDLPGGGQVTGRIVFSWNVAPRLLNVGVVPFETRVGLEDGRHQALAHPFTIAISPLPYLNTALGWLRGTVIVAGLGGLLLEQVKKRLFPAD